MTGVAKNRSQSAGSNWEAEFAQYSDAEQLEKASQHLELTWKVAKVCLRPGNLPVTMYALQLLNERESAVSYAERGACSVQPL